MSTNMAGRVGRDAAYPLFEKISNKFNISPSKKSSNRQLLSVVDDALLCWSPEDGCLFSQILDVPTSVVQTLALSRPPVWEVEQLVRNRNGSCLALVGSRGVVVVYLPLRSGTPPLFDRGKEAITCKVEYVAEHFLTCHPKLEVVSAAWHPGSLENNHIVILSSDNRLRIYNLSSTEIPEQTIAVGPGEVGVISTSSITCNSTLGEDAIGFDFGVPSELVKCVSGNPVSNHSFSYMLSTGASSAPQFSLQTSVKLHVYETVELELSLLPDDQGFTTPLLLHPDPTTPARYLVSHEAGVHTVTVPLVEKLLHYSELPDDAGFTESEFPCVVDHVLCTRLVTPATLLPVVGLVASASHSLFILLASGKVFAVTLPSAFLPELIEHANPEIDPVPSPLRKIHTENFENHIRSTLQRTTSQPLLASGTTGRVTPSEYIHLLNRVMVTLRTNYMQPQKVARMDMEKRSDILGEQKQRLKSDLEDLQARKKALTEKAHELAEKYEDASEKKCLLIGRLERVISRMMRTLPVLSSSEKKMMQELEAMQTHIPVFLNQLAQIKEKEKLTSQMETHHTSEASRGHQVSSISENQLKTLSEALSKEGEKLVSLTEKVNQAKQEFHL
ncbi:nucleoporin 88-like [Portunus trituberculatus]|uniref:nucleoporin 88-like n=1 Tax=Portunus trituberculatus TaxID=210409 RepID=UPI001E1CE571|nr:nucleoporin 88-like [Portunus trituberculatus]